MLYILDSIAMGFLLRQTLAIIFKWHWIKNVQTQSFFWSVFSFIRTEYGHLRTKSPYSLRMQEITDQKKLRIWTLFTQCEVLKIGVLIISNPRSKNNMLMMHLHWFFWWSCRKVLKELDLKRSWRKRLLGVGKRWSFIIFRYH